MTKTDTCKQSDYMKEDIIDWALQAPKQWSLSRFINVFKTSGNGLQLESFISRAQTAVDDIDLELLRALAVKGSQTVTELASTLNQNSPNVPIDELGRRLYNFASIAVVSSQDDPPVWWSLESACRRTPFIDFVEITNHCPSSCIMCRAAQGYMTRPRGFMQLELFERILDMIEPRKDFKPLILHNAGEPLLHPDLLSMVSMARKADIPTEISTNAGLLNFDTYKKLCDAGIARIVIAIDGIDIETLKAIRGLGALPQNAFKNIDAILNDRAAHRSNMPAIILQMVQMQANAHQHLLFRKNYGNLDLPGVSAFLKPVEAPANSPLFMPGTTPPQFFCVAPWQTLGIYWDGRVVPCCYDLNASLCLGNVIDQTLMEIWNSGALHSLRGRLVNNECLSGELCSICHHRPDRYQRSDLTTIREFPDDWH